MNEEEKRKRLRACYKLLTDLAQQRKREAANQETPDSGSQSVDETMSQADDSRQGGK